MFSKRSRSRMLKKFATMDFRKGKFVFITLTYGAEYPAPDVAKQHLRAFLKRLTYLSAKQGRKGGFIWRLEFQARGAPHFHIICTGLPFIPKEEVQYMWSDITGVVSPFTRIELIKSKRGVMFYVSKYLAKVEQSGSPSSCGFIYVPYQAKGSEFYPGDAQIGVMGRYWGIEQGKEIIYCEAAWIVVPQGSKFLYRLKQMAQSEWPMINPDDGLGFTLFTKNARQWFDRIIRLLDHEKRFTCSPARKYTVLRFG